MTAYGAYFFTAACAVVAVGAVFYSADVWLHATVAVMAALCWVTRRAAYEGIVRLICAVGLSGGAFALTVSAVLSVVAGMVEAAAMSFACAALSGMAASTQMRPAGRFMSDAAEHVRNRTV